MLWLNYTKIIDRLREVLKKFKLPLKKIHKIGVGDEVPFAFHYAVFRLYCLRAC